MAAAEAAEGGGASPRVGPAGREGLPGKLSLLEEKGLPEDGLDAIVIGAGQAGLAAGYHLNHAGLSFAILEAGEEPGGSWPGYYESLTLFSPARYSGLPGKPFPGSTSSGCPSRPPSPRRPCAESAPTPSSASPTRAAT